MADKTVSIKYLNNIKSSIGFKNGNAEEKTVARAKAISDIRNMASFAAANHYIVPKVNYKLIINADATQFQLGGDSKRKTKVIHDIKRDTNIEPLKVLPKNREALTAYFIKFYAIISAGGFLANPIYIIADDNMDPDDIDVHEISALGSSTSVHAKGYLVFCKTRKLNKEFYE